MASESQPRGRPSPEQIAGLGLDATAEGINTAGEQMLKAAPRLTRFALKRIPEGPGYVFDLATDKDKLRATFGIAGGVLGSIGGGALGGAAGGVNAPLGAVLGSSAGEEMGKELYDQNYQQIHKVTDPIWNGFLNDLDATRRWMTNRQGQQGQQGQ